MKIKHALLIDDNEIDNYITKTILTRGKIAEKITEMTSATEALDYLTSIKNNLDEFPDAIFLDINMPEMDGFGFLDAFIQLPLVNGNSVVFMLSSSTDPNDMDRALKYSVVKKYFNKPLRLEVFENNK